MVDHVNVAIEAMERAIQDKRVELEQLERNLAGLRASKPDYHAPPKTTEWTGMSITDATIKFLLEMVVPQETRDIANALRDRGVRTSSRNFTATVYSTLANNRGKFERKEGLWSVIIPKNRGAAKAFRELAEKKARQA